MRDSIFSTLLCLLIGSFTHVSNASALTELTQASYVVSDSDFPPQSVLWEKVLLPDNWQERVNPNGRYRSHWYKITVSGETLGLHRRKEGALDPHQPYGLYLPSLNMNAEAWINGEKIGSGGSFKKPLARNWHRPLLFSVPVKLLSDHNEIIIRVKAYADVHGRLGKVYIAPFSVIQPYYEQNLFASVTVDIVGAILALFISIVLFPVWFQRREPAYFWLMLGCFSWAIADFNTFLHTPPMATALWEVAMHVSMGWIPICMMIFILHYTNHVIAWIKYSAITVGAVFSAMLLIIPERWFFIAANLWITLALVYGIVGVICMLISWKKHHTSNLLWLGFCMLIIASLALHDLLVQLNVIGGPERMWLNYSSILILAVIALMMIKRFLKALQEHESLNKELEDRVDAASEKIKDSHEKIRLLEIEKAVHQERGRIHSDLHDDLGAKLLSITYQCKTSEQRVLAKEAMNTLREIVSKRPVASLESFTLAGFLARCRDEFEKRLAEAGIFFLWNKINLPHFIALPSHQADHIAMLLREAVSNALKADEVSDVSVTVRYRCACLLFRITNNGHFEEPQYWKEGTGMSTIKNRVHDLGGRVRWTVNQHGFCCAEILIPIQGD